MTEVQPMPQPDSAAHFPSGDKSESDASMENGAEFTINGITFSIEEKKNPKTQEARWVIHVKGDDGDGELFEYLVTKAQVDEAQIWVNEAMDLAKSGTSAMDIHMQMKGK